MDVNDVATSAGIYAFNKSKDVQAQQVLSAIGMTPETQKAQAQIDATNQNVAQATGNGVNVDIKA
ncbi:MAG: hypothetical protein GXO40_04175 [Epsilonproteobacteria bacterium]|nr:hypothetical protein [Campylobacterota bacterium]